MNRRTAAAAAAVTAALLGCATATATATAAPALDADHPSEAGPLGTHLRYHPTTWTSQGADMRIVAPRGWSFVLTPEGQARFNAVHRPDVLTMGYRGEGALRPQIESEVATLRGTPGLRILTAHGHGRGDTATGELRYLWTPPGGATRFVDYRYLGNDAYMVAGRLVDRPGLAAVLATAASTGECS